MGLQGGGNHRGSPAGCGFCGYFHPVSYTHLFSDIVQYMRDEYGINLEKKKVLIECRMSKILERYGLDSFAGYLDMVHQDRSCLLYTSILFLWKNTF